MSSENFCGYENIDEILFSAEQIQERVHQLGEAISKDYETKDPVLISMLKGAAIFTADLTRFMSVRLRWTSWRSPVIAATGVQGSCEYLRTWTKLLKAKK